MSEAIEKGGSWYQKLIVDIRKMDFAGIVLTKYAIGKRILEDFDKFGKPEYGSKRIENIGKDLETTKNNLWLCIQFARKFDSVKQLEGKSWTASNN